MKKLLGLLSVLTISGSAVPTTIAASPYQKNKQENELENLTTNYLIKLFKFNFNRQNRIEINLDVPIISQIEERNYCLAASIQMMFSYFNRNIIENTENGGHGYSQERIYIDNTACGSTGCNMNQNTADYIQKILQQHISDATNNYSNQHLVFNSIPQNYFANNFLQRQFFASYILESLHNNVPVIFVYFDNSLNGWHSIVINSISIYQNNFSNATFNYIDPNGANQYSFDTNILENYLSQGGFLIGSVGRPYFQDYNFDLVSHDGDLNYPQFDYHSLDDVMSCISNDIKYRKYNKCYIKPSIKLFYNDDKTTKEVTYDWYNNNFYHNTLVKTFNLGNIVPVYNFKKIEFLGKGADFKNTRISWGNEPYYSYYLNNFNGRSISQYIKNEKINGDYNSNKISDYFKITLQPYATKWWGAAWIDIYQGVGITFYWENNNWYLQLLASQYGHSSGSISGGSCFINLGNGIRLYND